ncbi:protein YIPF1 [Eupeodes corollae]|uniref:protein YIPF1 n=1 Tax=Eupeodes corollae TaxID=290404 RepID=UPI00248FE48B|nr:protein YIPF1 [Eupeodes corollae]XP_055914161.1 protein YIPF1 [Eupeodes corollae]
MDSNSEDLLTFKDFTSSSSSPQPAQISVNSPEKSSTGRSRDPLQALIYDMSKSANLQSSDSNINQANEGGSLEDTPRTVSFLTIEYYQQFFNVDTFMVIDRIASAVIPQRAPSNYLKSHIGTNPDLYGPFWITVTLIFSIAISGNVASYLQTANENYHWRYNFHLVSYAASCIFIYSCFVPGTLWGLMKYTLKPVEEDLETENATYTPSLLSLMCIYGYSLAVYIPVSILWVIQISILQWLLVLTAALASGSVLIAVLTPALRNSKISFFLMIGILGAHFLLAAGFMLYFFHVPNSTTLTLTNNLMQTPASVSVVSISKNISV